MQDEWITQWPPRTDDNLRVMQEHVRRTSLLGPWRMRPLRWRASWSIEHTPRMFVLGARVKQIDFDRFVGWDVTIWVVPFVPIHIWWYRRKAQR